MKNVSFCTILFFYILFFNHSSAEICGINPIKILDSLINKEGGGKATVDEALEFYKNYDIVSYNKFQADVKKWLECNQRYESGYY